jgi:hypothetical protein
MNGMTRTTDSRLAKSGVSVGKLLPPKAAKIESPLDALQTTFSDRNRMRRSAVGRARPAAASLKWGLGLILTGARPFGPTALRFAASEFARLGSPLIWLPAHPVSNRG